MPSDEEDAFSDEDDIAEPVLKKTFSQEVPFAKQCQALIKTALKEGGTPKRLERPKCELCGKSFRKESALELHRQSAHGAAGEVIADAETSMCQVGGGNSKAN